MGCRNKSIYMWQNNLCVTYTLQFKIFEDFFTANSWEICNNPEDADWILIGACAGFLPQIDDYLSEIKKLRPLNKKLAVFGCLPKIIPAEFKKSTPDSALYIPPSKPEKIEKIISKPRIRYSEIDDPGGFRKQDYRNFDPAKKFIIIQYGCNAGCVYCPHKIGMGAQHSRPMKEILKLIKDSLDSGAHTIFLEGMDSGSWGTDLNPPKTYIDLIKQVLDLPGKFQLHIGQFGSNWLLRYGESIIEYFSNPKITDIKIPIQSASPRILKLMGRDPGVLDTETLLKELRKKNPDLNLRTDLIIGFPTETEEELKLTLDFTRKHFDEVACFGFEIHPKTKIAKMDIHFYDYDFIEKRVEYAIDFLNEKPDIITHRGGQVAETLITRESKRKELKL